MSTSVPSLQDTFSTKIAEMQAAITHGDYVTQGLHIVKASGFEWEINAVIKNIVSFFMRLFGCGGDPWYAYRPEVVIPELTDYVITHQHLCTEQTYLSVEAMFATYRAQAADQENCRNLIQHNLTKLVAAKMLDAITLCTIQEKLQPLAATIYESFALQHPTESFALSPVSIFIALGMSLYAIEQEKKPLFLEKLGLPDGMQEMHVHHAVYALLRSLALPKEFTNGSITLAQAIGCKTAARIADRYIQFLKEMYQADVMVANDLQSTCNNWVSAKTQGLIPSILSNNDSACVLVNALHLQLSWTKMFEQGPHLHTVAKEFVCLDGTRAPVSMMQKTELLNLYQTDDFTMIELPYIAPYGRTLSQLIFLPNTADQLPALDSKLKAANFIQECRDNAKQTRVALELPATECESSFSLTEMLKGLGIPLNAFDKAIIDECPDVEVIHKTFVENNQVGTKAAAATAICFPECAELFAEKPVPLQIDRAYAYLIMDGNTLLFRGRISDAKAVTAGDPASAKRTGIIAKMKQLAALCTEKRNIAGLIAGRDAIWQFFLQNEGDRRQVVSLSSSGVVQINGISLQVTQDRLIDMAIGMLRQAEIGLLFNGIPVGAIPHHMHDSSVLLIDDYYLAKTEKNGETIVFIQDKNAWEGKANGTSLSINLQTQSVWKNGRPSMLDHEDEVLAKKILDAKKIKEAEQIPSGRHQLASAREEMAFDDLLNRNPPLGILPGLRYTGGCEIACREIYFDQCINTRMRVEDNFVVIDPSGKPGFDRNQFIQQLSLWFGPAQIEGNKVFFNNEQDPTNPDTVVMLDSALIKISVTDYVTLVNACGDRWMARFCSW